MVKTRSVTLPLVGCIRSVPVRLITHLSMDPMADPPKQTRFTTQNTKEWLENKIWRSIWDAFYLLEIVISQILPLTVYIKRVRGKVSVSLRKLQKRIIEMKISSNIHEPKAGKFKSLNYENVIKSIISRKTFGIYHYYKRYQFSLSQSGYYGTSKKNHCVNFSIKLR